ARIGDDHRASHRNGPAAGRGRLLGRERARRAGYAGPGVWAGNHELGRIGRCGQLIVAVVVAQETADPPPTKGKHKDDTDDRERDPQIVGPIALLGVVGELALGSAWATRPPRPTRT